MEIGQMNESLCYLSPPQSVNSWLPGYSLNGCDDCAEHLTDQPFLTAISNTGPKSEATRSLITPDLNTDEQNATSNVPPTSHRPHCNANGRCATSSVPMKAATSPIVKSGTKLERKRTQNRIAQKTFRQRKQQETEKLQIRNKELEDALESLRQENRQLQSLLSPFNESQELNVESTKSCFICRHVLQLWRNGMICPESVAS